MSYLNIVGRFRFRPKGIFIFRFLLCFHSKNVIFAASKMFIAQHSNSCVIRVLSGRYCVFCASWFVWFYLYWIFI